MSHTPDEEDHAKSPEDFNKDHLKEFSISILKKPLYLRTQKDKEIVQEYASKIEFFKPILEEQGPIKFAELCDNLNYSYLPAGEILFKAGDIGTTFYVILEGTVEIILNIPAKDDEGNERVDALKVGELHTGQSFGELALLEGVSQARKATIASKPGCPCHFATLERQPFREILIHFSKAVDEQIEFLELMPFFKYVNWSRRSIQQWLKFFEMKVYSMNHVLYKEGDPCDDIYLIKSGEVRCTKSVEIKDKKNSFMFDEDNVLHPSQATLVTKQVELGSVIKGQFFGEEEATFSYYLNHREEWVKTYTNARGRLTEEREAIMLKIESLIKKNWLVKEEGPSFLNTEEIKYKSNSMKQITREATVTVKTAKAEIWKISAKHFFLQLETNPQAYKYLLSKIEQGSKRRDERLPRLAKITPTLNTYKGRRQRLIPSDDSFLSLLKQKKENRFPTESNVSRNDSSNYGIKVELVREQSKIFQPSPEEEDSKFLNSQSLLKTSAYEETSPLNGSFLKVSQHTSGEALPKVSHLLDTKPTQGGFRQKLEAILQGQNFSHTSLSPSKRSKSKRKINEDDEDDRIMKISNRKDSSPIHNEDLSYRLDSGGTTSPNKLKNEKVTKVQPRNFPNRSKTLAKEKSISLYDENSRVYLFPKADDKKPKRTRTLEPLKIKPKERMDTVITNDSLLSRLIGNKVPSIVSKGQQRFLSSQSPPKVRPNFVKDYLKRDNTNYKTPFLERLMTKSSKKEVQENQSYLTQPKERDDLKDAIRIKRLGSDSTNTKLTFMGLVKTKSIVMSMRNAKSKGMKQGSL